MIRGMYTAASAMLAQTVRNDLVANNLANANTTSYKKDDSLHSEFPRMLVTRMGGHDRPVSRGKVDLGYLGTGVGVRDIYTDRSQGSLQETGDPFNMAISNEGYFVVEKEGQYLFTRDGSFSLDRQGYLVTKEGYPVQGEGGPIRLEGDRFVVNDRGEIWEDGVVIDQLFLVDFPDSSKLDKIGSCLYRMTDEAGQPMEAEDARVSQGYLEASNVNPVAEMVKMITVMRAYEACQKVIQAQDNCLEQGVGEVGRI